MRRVKAQAVDQVSKEPFYEYHRGKPLLTSRQILTIKTVTNKKANIFFSKIQCNLITSDLPGFMSFNDLLQYNHNALIKAQKGYHSN